MLHGGHAVLEKDSTIKMHVAFANEQSGQEDKGQEYYQLQYTWCCDGRSSPKEWVRLVSEQRIDPRVGKIEAPLLHIRRTVFAC